MSSISEEHTTIRAAIFKQFTTDSEHDVDRVDEGAIPQFKKDQNIESSDTLKSYSQMAC